MAVNGDADVACPAQCVPAAPATLRRSGRWRKLTSSATSSGAACCTFSSSGVAQLLAQTVNLALHWFPSPLACPSAAAADQYFSPPLAPSPLLSEGDFEAKPSVLLLGQYSTGKSTFIKYLLVRLLLSHGQGHTCCLNYYSTVM